MAKFHYIFVYILSYIPKISHSSAIQASLYSTCSTAYTAYKRLLQLFHCYISFLAAFYRTCRLIHAICQHLSMFIQHFFMAYVNIGTSQQSFLPALLPDLSHAHYPVRYVARSRCLFFRQPRFFPGEPGFQAFFCPLEMYLRAARMYLRAARFSPPLYRLAFSSLFSSLHVHKAGFHHRFLGNYQRRFCVWFMGNCL